MISPHHATTALLLLLSGTIRAFELSYVLEPFEGKGAPYSTWLEQQGAKTGNSSTTSGNAFDVGFTDDAYAGDSALRVDYDSTTTGGEILALSITVVQENRPHIGVGATHLSLWYSHDGSSSTATSPWISLRVVLLEDSGECLGCDDASVEYLYLWDHWTALNKVLQPEEEEEEGSSWNEIRLSLDADTFQQSNPQSNGNGALDLHRIRGFTLNFHVQPGAQGQIRIDNLALVGGPDLFAAALHATNNFQALVDMEGGWEIDALDAQLARDNSTVVMDQQEGTMDIDYLVQQSENWGGLLAYSYTAPGAAYYNLSNATHLSFSYQINEAVSEPDRVHLRFILVEGSDCQEKCDQADGELERYYSFHYVLADETYNTTKQISIPLEGGTTNFFPFWLAGWSGVLGNSRLDTDVIKGYTFEFSMDQYGDQDSYATGAIALSDLEALDYDPMANLYNETGDSMCISEPGIGFNGYSSVFSKKEFVGDRCCEVCEEDPTCIYVLSTGRDCYLASHLEADSIGLDVPIVGDYTVVRKETTEAFWMDSEVKRGDFCVLCECHSHNQTIDCRGKNLTVVPKTFNKTKGEKFFVPSILDLRENPNLVLLGSGSLHSIAGGLKQLYLPKEMIHLGEYSLDNIPNLTHVFFEGQESSAHPLIAGGNIIARRNDYFGAVCCGLGRKTQLAWPANGLTFCNTTHVNVIDPPGIDSAYEEFARYMDPTVLRVLRPSSDFMSEAAESAGSCAEFCSINRGCRYFSYDNRISNAEPICLFLEDAGQGLETICCEAGQFSDENQTSPGWISGRPAGTRHLVDNATVLVEPKALSLNPENGYEWTFDIALGATPLRGAVYVTPVIVGDDGLNVTMWPWKVGLYNENISAHVHVKVSGIEEGAPSKTFAIHASIESCDQAFTALDVSSCEESLSISVAVDIPHISVEEDYYDPLAHAATAVGCVAVLLVLLTAALLQKNNEKKAIKFAQIEFLRLLLLGSFLTSCGAILVAVPPNDVTCMAAVWCIEVGYTAELIPLIVKIAALNRLMAAAEKMRRIKLKRESLFGAVALIMGLVVVYLIVWTVLDPSQKTSSQFETKDEKGYTTATTTYYCSGYTSAWSIAALAWKTVLLLAASVLAFQTRSIKRQAFNESQTLAFLIYSHFVFICMRFGLLFLTEAVGQDTLIKVRSILNSTDTIAAVIVYFLPKLMASDDGPDARGATTSSVYVTTTMAENGRRYSTYISQPPMNDTQRPSGRYSTYGLQQQPMHENVSSNSSDGLPQRVKVSTRSLLSSVHEASNEASSGW